MWPNEPYDFTPWLAKNLDRLGEAIDLTLAPVQEEYQVGAFSLDILARETNEDVKVAIENELEWSDHWHLGQLLTYAAGCDARIAIWVAPEFRYEHAGALHRLNEWAGTNVRFYGVKVEVIRTVDGGALHPRLRTVVRPGDWNKALTQDPGETTSPHNLRHRNFFQPMVTKLLGSNVGFADSVRQYGAYTGGFFPSRLDKNIGYASSLSGNRKAWVIFSIETHDSEFNKSLYDALHSRREEIESRVNASLPAEWYWDRGDRYWWSGISIVREGSIDDSPEKLAEIQAWMLHFLPKMKDVFDPLLAKLLGELRQ